MIKTMLVTGTANTPMIIRNTPVNNIMFNIPRVYTTEAK